MAENTSILSASAEQRRERIRATLARRHLFERIFRGMGILAILIALVLVGSLFWMVISKGYPAFTQANISTEIHLVPAGAMPAPGRDASSG